MDTVTLLFRLIVKIAKVEGIPRQPHLPLDSVEGGGVSVQNATLCLNSNAIADSRTR